MNPDLTNTSLFRILSEVKPLELEGSDAFKQAIRPQTGEIFPSLQGIDKQQVMRMAIEVKNYTTRCWKATKRLQDLNPVPANVYIPEFGIV
ncbi:MAG: hypothetical protein AAFQ57_11160 [Cyanobacteria bacterium J06626_14]